MKKRTVPLFVSLLLFLGTYLPCLLMGMAGAFFGSIAFFFIASSEVAWGFGTVSLSVISAFAGITLTRVTGTPIGPKARFIVPIAVGLFCGLAMVLCWAIQNATDPL
jgi:hypothetical protein